MIYITGDTHGDQERWMQQIHPALRPGDTILIAGDFGVGGWDGRYFDEEAFYDWLEEQCYTVLFVDGNHCNFDKLQAYEVIEWCGGRVRRLRKNLLHLMRGEVYHLEAPGYEGKTLFAFGGGYSMDKALRVPGETWWPQELPNEAEYARGREMLARNGNRVDYIVTHTAPYETILQMVYNPRMNVKQAAVEELPLNSYLSEIARTADYAHWYFGHFHQDAARPLWRELYPVFWELRELGSGEILPEAPPV